MKSLRVVWFVTFLLALSPLAVGQSLVNVRRHQPKVTPGQAGNPGKFAKAWGRKIPTPKRDTGSSPGTLVRPEDPLRLGRGERDPISAGAPPGPAQGPVWLSRHEVKLSVVDGIAVTEIDQTFKNGGRFQMEGTYVCPLPENAVLNGFSIFMAGREVHGSVLERREARRVYDRIVGRRRDPGLVELMGNGESIRTSIFPIPPLGEMRVRTRYACLLDTGLGVYTASVPFPVAKSTKDRPITEVKVDLRFQSSWPMRLSAPDGFRVRTRDRGCFWSATFKAEAYSARGNLDLLCRSYREEPGLTVNVNVGPHGQRTFVAIIGAGNQKLSSVRLKFKGAKVLSMFPEKIPVVKVGGQTLVFGSLEGTARPVVTLDARQGFSRVFIQTPVARISTTAKSTRHIPCFWALGQVNAMIDEGNLEEADRQRIVALSMRYGILTPYTAFLAK